MGVHSIIDISYLTGPDAAAHTLDFFKEDSDKPQPLLVFVHGGAWGSGDKEDLHQFAQFFVKHSGYSVALVNYRLSTTKRVLLHPAHCEDVIAALEYLRKPNPTLVYDPSNLHLAGHSCGAHILTSIFLDSHSVTPSLKPSQHLLQSIRSISLSEGLYDLDLFVKTFPPTRGFMSGAFGQVSSFDRFSTVNYPVLNADIRWLVIHSTGDELVNQAQSEAIWNHLVSQKAIVSRDWTTLDKNHDENLSEEAYAVIIAQFVKGEKIA